MLVAVLSFLGRTRCKEVYGDYFDIMEPHFDRALVNTWAYMQEKSDVTRCRFLCAYKFAASMIMDMPAVEEIESTVADQKPIDVGMLRRVLQTRLGRVLYADEAKNLEFTSYVDQVKSRLDTVVHVSYSPEEVKGSLDVLRHLANNLMKNSTSAFDKKAHNFKFLLEDVQVDITNANDVWAFAYAAMNMEIALNSESLPRLPWESVCFGKDERIEGIPSTVKVPEAALVAHLNVRHAAAELLGPGRKTLNQMKHVMLHHRAALLMLDRTWVVVDTWLQTQAQTVLETQIKSKVLAALPMGTPTQTDMESSLAALQAILAGPQAHAAGTDFARDIDGVVVVLTNLLDGIAPKVKHIHQYGGFQNSCLQLMSNWCIASYVKGAGKSGATKETMYGNAAMKHYVSTMETELQNGLGKVLNDFSVFRRFGWLLDKKDTAKVDSWIAKATAAHHKGALSGVQHVLKDGEVTDKAGGELGDAIGLKKHRETYCLISCCFDE
jgi:hypothetical protein